MPGSDWHVGLLLDRQPGPRHHHIVKLLVPHHAQITHGVIPTIGWPRAQDAVGPW